MKRTRAAIFITFVVALAASLVIQNGVLASTLQQTPLFSWSLTSSCRRWKIEFVDTACGTHQYVNDRFQFVHALPVICIEDDGIERVCPVLLSLVSVGYGREFA